jgi:hypothetical protein
MARFPKTSRATTASAGPLQPAPRGLRGRGRLSGPPPRLMHHAPLTPDLLLPARWSHPTPGGRTMTKKPTKGYVVDGRPMTADDLKRLHDYLADIEWIDVTSDEMRIVVESEWPEFIPQAAIETMIPRGTYFRRPIGESRRTKPNTSSVPRLRLDRLPRPQHVRARKAIAAPRRSSRNDRRSVRNSDRQLPRPKGLRTRTPRTARKSSPTHVGA